MKKIVLSAFSDEYADGLIEQCKALSEFGIGFSELRGIDGKNISELTNTQICRVKEILNEYQIKPSAIGSPIGKISLDGDLNAHLEMVKRVFESAQQLGTNRIRVFSFYMPNGDTAEHCRGRVLAEMEKLVKLSEEYGVTLCHENEALIYGESPERCLELAEYFGGKLRCVFDMGNFVLDGYDPIKAYGMLKSYIEYFHIKDAMYAGAIVPPGAGEAKIKEIISQHREEGEGEMLITLEPHLQTFSGLNALVGKSFDNPYKYENREVAFCDALARLRGLLSH